MAFNPLQNFLGGQQAGQRQQANNLAGSLAGQAQNPEFRMGQSEDFRQLMAIDPDRANKTMSTFQSLGEDRKKAYFDDMVTGKAMLMAGDLSGFGKFQENRLQNLKRLESEDTTGTEMIINKFNQGDIQGLIAGYDSGINAGIQLGYIKAGPQAEKKSPFQRGEGGLVFDPNTGTYTVDELAQKNLAELAERKELQGGLGIKDKQSINKDITGFIKNSRAIRTTANDLEKLSELGTGPAAIAAVFKFMKANDPQSTVREGEFATAEQSAGIPLQVTNFYNKLVTGERVEGTQIKQFVDTAKVLANSAITSATTEVDGYLNTFGDDFPTKFQKTVRDRIPIKFKLANSEALPPSIKPARALTSPSGVSFTVGE